MNPYSCVQVCQWSRRPGFNPKLCHTKDFKKMVLDTYLLNTQQYKVRIKRKEEQPRERSSTPLHLSVVAIEKGAFWSPSAKVTIFTYLLKTIQYISGQWKRTVLDIYFQK